MGRLIPLPKPFTDPEKDKSYRKIALISPVKKNYRALPDFSFNENF